MKIVEFALEGKTTRAILEEIAVVVDQHGSKVHSLKFVGNKVRLEMQDVSE